jgi:hypothetical protein
VPAVAVAFNCSKCGQKLTLTSSKPGDWLDCPACEATIQIPGAAPKTAQAPQQVTPPVAPESLDFLAAAAPRSREPKPGLFSDKRVQVGVLAGVVGLLLVGIVGAVLAFQKPKKPPEQVRNDPLPTNPLPTTPPPTTPPVIPPVMPPVTPKPDPLPEKPKSTLAEVELTQTKQRTLKLGVNGKGYDDVGAILTSLGKGYSFATLANLDLEDADRLKQFDVIFLNCGGQVGRVDLTQKALREFIAAGKTIYASDLQYDLIASTFPDAADAKAQSKGTNGTYDAEVLDRGLQELLGKTVELTFNLGGWQAAAFRGNGVAPILTATDNGRLKKGTPLLVKFTQGQSGTVFFTSFHNSAIASDTAKKLLRYLVFSAVIADAEGRVMKVLKREDFNVKPPELLTAPDAAWSVTRTHVQKKDGVFRVGLGFNNEGAEVRLVIEGPDGTRLEKVGKDAFIAEVRYGPPGEWKITLSMKTLPYPNFPISLVVADPK